MLATHPPALAMGTARKCNRLSAVPKGSWGQLFLPHVSMNSVWKQKKQVEPLTNPNAVSCLQEKKEGFLIFQLYKFPVRHAAIVHHLLGRPPILRPILSAFEDGIKSF